MLEKFIALVKSQIAHYEGQIKRYPPNHPGYRPNQVAKYERFAQEHRALLEYLEQQKTRETFAGVSVPPVPNSDADDITGLPPELLAELSMTSAKAQSDVLVQIINERGGTATLDQILIDLYKKHGEVGKRVLIQNRLYRLYKKGHLWPLPGRKGVYTTAPQTDGDGSERNGAQSDIFG